MVNKMADKKKQATRASPIAKPYVELGAKYDNLIVLSTPIWRRATKTGMFKKAYPDRFFGCRPLPSRYLMLEWPAGLTTTGKLVFCRAFAMFAAGRAYEQVRNAVGYTHLNVKIGATHAGLSVGEDGATHQCCEDIALMRTIPGHDHTQPGGLRRGQSGRTCCGRLLKGRFIPRFGRLAVEQVSR